MGFPFITHFTMAKLFIMLRNYQSGGAMKALIQVGLGLSFFPVCVSAEEIGQFGPPEAYLNGSPFPYFGSENPWDRRAFSPEKTS